jgi:hypothetical protein
VLPGGFHRIRHYGLLANPVRREELAMIRALLHALSSSVLASVPEIAGCGAVHTMRLWQKW